MNFGLYEIICGIATVILLFYYIYTLYYNYWRVLGVKGPRPIPIFGTNKDSIMHKCSTAQQYQKHYTQFPNEPVIGIFSKITPILMLKDPDIIQDILIKDFSIWTDRNRKVFEKVEPLSQHLVSLSSESWRPLRKKLTPIFTSGKLKEMFYIINECGDHLNIYLKNLNSLDKPIEVREMTAKFTTDVIGNCAFGLKMNALSDEKSEFREMGRKIFHINYWRLFRFTVREHFPSIYTYLSSIFHESETTNFFINIVKNTIDYREKNNINRNDFVDHMRNLKDTTDKVGKMEVNDAFLASQAFIFFVAGFETSSSTISYILYELAQNESVQDKLRCEILEELKRSNGILSYEAVNSMKYLHQVFQETLRMHPPAPQLTRKSNSEYTFNGLNITVPAGQAIVVPILAIHHDPKIYPEPEVFNPERFSEENIKNRHPMYYLPFGDGPRNCIGSRFAIYQTKVGIIKILQNHRVYVCDKTEIPYTVNARSVLHIPKNGMYLKFKYLIGNDTYK